MNRTIKKLAYVELYSQNPAETGNFFKNLFGWEISEGEQGQIYVAVDRYHHRLSIYPRENPGLKATGWQVFNKRDFFETAGILENAGVPYEMGTEADCNERKVSKFLAFNDPAGNKVEVCYAPYVTRPNVESIGHLNIMDLLHTTLLIPKNLFEDTLSFYEDILRFNVSDLANNDRAFTRCSQNHHNLALVGVDVPEAKIQHFMFEVESLDDVMKTYYRGKETKLNMKGPDKHSNCKTVHVYVQIPGMEAITQVEIGWGHKKIQDDDQWEVVRYSLSPSEFKKEIVNPWMNV